MGKIKSLFEEQKADIKDVFLKYISTIIAVFLLCIVVIAEIDSSSNSWDIYEQVMGFFLIYACGSFFIETLFNNNKIIMYVVNAFVSLILTIIGFNLDEWISEAALETYAKFFFLYIMLILGISIYVIIKNSGLSFQRYANTVILNFLKWGLIFFIFNAGIVIILGIFNSLIFEIDEFDLITKFELLLAGIMYFPYALICVLAKKEERSKFNKVVVKYILMPMLIIAMAIIYIYILKMLFTLSVPKNEVFGICAGVFCLGFVISTMAYAYIDADGENADADLNRAEQEIAGYKNSGNSDAGSENEGIGNLGIYDKIIKYFKYGFIPMVLLEIYAVGVRISAYGVTEDRYMGVVFIIAQIIYLLWEPIDKLISGFRKKDNAVGYGKGYEKLIFVAILIYIFTIIVPFTSIEYICFASQKKRMENAIEKNDYVTAYSAYSQINYNKYGKKYIDKSYSKEDIEKLYENYNEAKGYGENDYYYYETYINPNYEQSDIEIYGYSRMYTFDSYIYDKIDYKSETLRIEPDTQKVSAGFDVKLNEIVEDALTDYGYNYNSDGRNNYDYSKKPAREYIYGDKKLIITSISFYYYEDGKTINNLSLRGYVLLK
ncbi:MAG: DUF4153 domain-containing protein [Lachnospiraceae bacterium]|nr:DUF4153 domain-containing protein [Lachnospiraceae bacterium]